MGRRARYVGCTRHVWPCRRSADRHLCRTEIHSMGRQRPCIWQPCTAIRKCGRRICCTCMGNGHHCSHYQGNGYSVARRHKGYSKGRRGRSGPCTAWRKGICNRRIGSGVLHILSFLLLLFYVTISIIAKKCVGFTSDKLLLSEQV